MGQFPVLKAKGENRKHMTSKSSESTGGMRSEKKTNETFLLRCEKMTVASHIQTRAHLRVNEKPVHECMR